MITELLIAAVTTLTAILVANIVTRFIKVHLAYAKYKRAAKGIPMLPENWLPDGNSHQMMYGPYTSLKMDALHRRYGKTFGWMYSTQPVASTIDLDMMKTICIDEQDQHINRLDHCFPIKELEKDNIGIVQDDQWRRIRRAITPSFTKHRVMSKNVLEEIDSVIRNLLNSLDERLRRAGEHNGNSIVIQADDIILRFSTDLIFSCLYKHYGSIDYLSDQDYFSHLLEAAIKETLNPVIEISHALPACRIITDRLVDHFSVLGLAKKEVREFIKKQTKLNLEAKRHMAKAKQEGIAFDPDEFTIEDGTKFKRNMIDPFIDSYHEGIKTSADAVTRLLYRLASHIEVQEKLRQSIRQDGFESEYLGWCINESLRLDPPVPAGCSRQIKRDIKVEGGIVPSKTMLMTPTYMIHRMPEYWGEDAEQYRPDRWQNADNFHPLQYMAFGAGRRGCPGKEFTLCEMKRLMCQLLTHYRIERCSKTSDSKLFHAPFYSYTVYEAPVYVKISKL